MYELAGFEALLGPVITGRLKTKGTTLKTEEVAEIPRVRVGIKNRDPYRGLDSLTVRKAIISEGKIELTMASEDRLIEVDLTLNFPEERMVFDIDNGLRVADDGSEDSARQIVSVLHFMRGYICNGKLQVFNAETNSLLGRKDTFIPLNIAPGFAADHIDQLIDKYESEAETRAAKVERGAAGA